MLSLKVFILWLLEGVLSMIYHPVLRAYNSADAELRTRDVIPPGTLVSLEKCACKSCSRGENTGVWKVIRYDVDADDYKLEHVGDARTTFARANIMTLCS